MIIDLEIKTDIFKHKKYLKNHVTTYMLQVYRVINLKFFDKRDNIYIIVI